MLTTASITFSAMSAMPSGPRAKAGADDVITPSTIGFKPQTYIGTSNLQALLLGGVAIFAQAKGYAVFELAYDYAFILPERHSPAAKRRYPCHCGSARCRGTILAKKR